MKIGIDLGGTNIAAAIVGDDGGILKRAVIPANAQKGAGTVKGGLLEVCGMLAEDLETAPESVGIGVPGTVNNA